MAKALDKKVCRKIAETFIMMACDNTGQPVKAKSLDRIMEDILGTGEFFHRLCKIRTDQELRVIFNGANIMAILSIVENERQLNTLYSMLELDREMYTLKRKIKRYTKKGKKCKSLRERYNKLEKIYRKAIKTFKDLLGVRDFKKDAKPSKKYSDIVNFTKRHSDNYGIYDEIFGYDYDDEDDEPFFTGHYRDEYGRPMNDLVYREKARGGTLLFGDDDEDGEDDEDYDDDNFDVKLALDEMNERNQKILSAIGKLISIQSTGAQYDFEQRPKGEVMSADQFSFIDDDEEDDEDIDDYGERLNRLESAVMSLVDYFKGGEVRAVVDIKGDLYEESAKAMNLIFNGDGDEAYEAPDPDTLQPTVKYEEETHVETVVNISTDHLPGAKDYTSMETKELIAENNTKV